MNFPVAPADGKWELWKWDIYFVGWGDWRESSNEGDTSV